MNKITETLRNALTFERALGMAAAFVVTASALALVHAFVGAEFAGQVTVLVGA
ncbi:MAG: hypothetical protein JNK75_10940 [Betaproteobacteria bacterium]|nr:hypothetical protein [Betaproteobacteria bacterium]